MDGVQDSISQAGQIVVEDPGDPEFVLVHLVRASGSKKALNDFDCRGKEHRGRAGEQPEYHR